jgi:uncharacterized repeat protein (TIGR03803 family)
MKRSVLKRYVSWFAAAAMLAGCGPPQAISPPAGQLANPAAAHRLTIGYNSLYIFRGGRDGAEPVAGLLLQRGKLYGTTWNGGTNNDGTIFAVTGMGVETILYRFKGGKDGRKPAAGIINVNDTLYGTTSSGGAGNDGTVFAITTFGNERVLHRFGSSGDGAEPYAGLLHVNGTLYGTTRSGGANGQGTVFAITTSGKETVLHSFGASGDGANPLAELINAHGTLYGTTSSGGAYSCGSRGSCGTVFSITTSGTEKVLHSFGQGADGGEPHASLIRVKDTLYGTTSQGGTSGGCGGYGCGTVFSITTGGTENVLLSFGVGLADGITPDAALIGAHGYLFGTASGGGGYNDGIVFRIFDD